MGMKKGVVPSDVILAIVLVIIFILVIGQFIYFLLHSQTKIEYFVFDVYVAKNGMNLANFYLQDSLDYAVYQAMFDNGRRGGLDETPAGAAYNYWQETGGVISPSKKDVENHLKSEVAKNLNKYVAGGYTFLGKYYALPIFKSDEIKVNDLKDGTEAAAETSGTIYFHDVIPHLTGEERVSIESVPLLVNKYPVDYFGLYDKSVEVFGEVKTLQCAALKKGDKPKDNEKSSSYLVNAVVLDKIDTPCEATVKINVTDSSSRFPVFDGTTTTFQNVSMVFLVKIV